MPVQVRLPARIIFVEEPWKESFQGSFRLLCRWWKHWGTILRWRMWNGRCRTWQMNCNHNQWEKSETTVDKEKQLTKPVGDLGELQLQFWTGFVEYCKQEGRETDIARYKPLAQNWYDVPVSDADYHLSFTVTRSRYLSLLIYAYNKEAFERLERKKPILKKNSVISWIGTPAERAVKRNALSIKERQMFLTR